VLGSIKEMGYISVNGLWYSIEQMLHLLSNDNGAINMVNMANRYGEVHLFVVHGVDEAEVVDNIVESECGVHGPLESGDSSQVGHTIGGEKEGEVVDKEKGANDEVVSKLVRDYEVELDTKIVLRDVVGTGLEQFEFEVGGEGVGAGIK